jgi:multidrug resistance efflux pump
MENQKGGFFSGLKKMIFKEEEVPLPSQQPEPAPAKVVTPVEAESRPVGNFGASTASLEAREDAAKKAYQLIESINQPGVDFFEVWNAVEENGGLQATSLKQAFNTLKFADKTLTKEKLLSSGNYYKTELQKALDNDIQKKNGEKTAITNKIKDSKETLAAEINSLEEQVVRLQKTIAEKQAELSNLQAHWQPKLEDIEKKIQTGRHAIEGVLSKMQTLLNLAEKEL